MDSKEEKIRTFRLNFSRSPTLNVHVASLTSDECFFLLRACSEQKNSSGWQQHLHKPILWNKCIHPSSYQCAPLFAWDCWDLHKTQHRKLYNVHVNTKQFTINNNC